MGWLELWKFHSTALLAGCALDWMFGDPVCIPHLVRLMGRMIARLELELRRRMRGRELAAGAVLTFIMCAAWSAVPDFPDPSCFSFAWKPSYVIR